MGTETKNLPVLKISFEILRNKFVSINIEFIRLCMYRVRVQNYYYVNQALLYII